MILRILLALLLTLGPAFAQVPMTGAGKAKPGAAATPPTINFQATAIPTGGLTTTMVATGVDLGTLTATSRVIVITAGGFSTTNIVNGSSTIGAGTVDDSGQCIASGSGVSIWWASAPVSTGGSQTITLEFAAAPNSFGAFGVYVVDGANLIGITPVAGFNTASLVTTVSGTVATLSGGSIISSLYTASGTASQTISSSTASLSTDANNIFGSAGYGHANGTGAVGSSSVTWTWTTASDAGVCNLAYR